MSKILLLLCCAPCPVLCSTGLAPRWENASWWKRLPDRAPTACPTRAAFVSILSGEEHMPLALCLAAQLQRVGTRCPHVLVHDDRPTHALAQQSLVRLSRAHARLYPASYLFGQANLSLEHAWDNSTGGARGMPPRAFPAGERAPGRRLFGNPAEYTGGTMMPKLFLWAFGADWDRLVFLDLDVVVQHNIDVLLTLPFSESIAAVEVPGCAHPSHRGPFFNGGVLVLKPSRELLKAILLRSCFVHKRDWDSRKADIEAGQLAPAAYWHRTQSAKACTTGFLSNGEKFSGNSLLTMRACEMHLLDQSVLNFQFPAFPVSTNQYTHHALPYGYNVYSKWWNRPPLVPVREMAIMHYPGEPKPWSPEIRALWAEEKVRRTRETPNSPGLLETVHELAAPWSKKTMADVRLELAGRWLETCERFMLPLESSTRPAATTDSSSLPSLLKA